MSGDPLGLQFSEVMTGGFALGKPILKQARTAARKKTPP